MPNTSYRYIYGTLARTDFVTFQKNSSARLLAVWKGVCLEN